MKRLKHRRFLKKPKENNHSLLSKFSLLFQSQRRSKSPNLKMPRSKKKRMKRPKSKRRRRRRLSKKRSPSQKRRKRMNNRRQKN
jgi:hypothetical protein